MLEGGYSLKGLCDSVAALAPRTDRPDTPAATEDEIAVHPLAQRALEVSSSRRRADRPAPRRRAARYDGTGYPDRLAGDEIPLNARIVSVCDAFDAIVTNRAYRTARFAEQAIAELQRCAGGQFDPRVVAAFTTAHRRLKEHSAALAF